jgi:hypothetical protein
LQEYLQGTSAKHQKSNCSRIKDGTKESGSPIGNKKPCPLG